MNGGRMNQQQEQIMMEAQAEMMQMMMNTCRSKTTKNSHTNDTITADEKKQFSACVMKFMEAPMHLQAAMQGQQM